MENAFYVGVAAMVCQAYVFVIDRKFPLAAVVLAFCFLSTGTAFSSKGAERPIDAVRPTAANVHCRQSDACKEKLEAYIASKNKFTKAQEKVAASLKKVSDDIIQDKELQASVASVRSAFAGDNSRAVTGLVEQSTRIAALLNQNRAYAAAKAIDSAIEKARQGQSALDEATVNKTLAALYSAEKSGDLTLDEVLDDEIARVRQLADRVNALTNEPRVGTHPDSPLLLASLANFRSTIEERGLQVEMKARDDSRKNMLSAAEAACRLGAVIAESEGWENEPAHCKLTREKLGAPGEAPSAQKNPVRIVRAEYGYIEHGAQEIRGNISAPERQYTCQATSYLRDQCEYGSIKRKICTHLKQNELGQYEIQLIEMTNGKCDGEHAEEKELSYLKKNDREICRMPVDQQTLCGINNPPSYSMKSLYVAYKCGDNGQTKYEYAMENTILVLDCSKSQQPEKSKVVDTATLPRLR